MPVVGGAIQFAIFPGSVTGCIRLRTYSRSSIVGNHSDFRLLEFFFGDQVAVNIKVMAGVFANVAMKATAREINPLAETLHPQAPCSSGPILFHNP